MAVSFLSFVLRAILVVMLWFFVWRVVEPKTQLMRILRAVLLVLCLLGVLVVLKITGGN
jgi:membrane protein DedA with SNARE-associated domain